MDPTTVSGTKNSFSTPSAVLSTLVHWYLYALPLGQKERVTRDGRAGHGRPGRAGGRARRRPTVRRRCVAPRGPCRACAARQAGGMRACRCACHSRWPGARNRPLGTGKPAAARAGPSSCRGAVSSAPDPRYVGTRPLRACLPRGGPPSRSCRTSRSRRKCLSLLCALRSPHGAVRRRHRPQPPPGRSDVSPTCPEVQHSRHGVLACRVCICPPGPSPPSQLQFPARPLAEPDSAPTTRRDHNGPERGLPPPAAFWDSGDTAKRPGGGWGRYRHITAPWGERGTHDNDKHFPSGSQSTALSAMAGRHTAGKHAAA